VRQLFRWWPVVGGLAGLALGIWFLAKPHGLPGHPEPYFWLFLSLLMLHHFEEAAFPGGIQTWLNETIFHSADPRSPFSDGRAFANDVVLGWGGFAVAAIVGTRLTWLALVPMFVLAFDAWFHISYTVASGRYSPGSATALFLVVPTTFYAASAFLDRGLVSYLELGVAAALGLLVDASFFIVLRRLGRTAPLPQGRRRAGTPTPAASEDPR
jgi:Protein of unknown function with HXXEE motif